jgi:hypothetical protein
MLAKKPGDRYASPAEVAESLRPFAAGADLVSLLDGDEIAATPADQAAVTPGPAKLKTTPGRDRPASSRRRYTLPAAVACLGLILLGVSLLWPGWWNWSSADAKQLRVTELRVVHYREDGKERFGDLRTSTAAVQLNDSVEVAAEFNVPAYCYLIALNPKGGAGDVVQLCHPEGKDGEGVTTARPDKSKEVRYPREKAFLLDVTGLQAFVIATSTKPLPPFGEWKSRAGAIPWDGVNDSGNSRWHFDGREYTRFLPQDRGKLVPKDGAPKPLQELCDWFKRQPEFEAVQVIAFPVVDEKK